MGPPFLKYDGWSESLKGLFVEEEYNEEFDETWTLHEECLGKDPSGIQQQAASDMAALATTRASARPRQWAPSRGTRRRRARRTPISRPNLM
eukprot:982538-Pyramimonas_sp.AAC.1